MERVQTITWPSTRGVEGKSYPGFWQAALLCLLFLAFQMSVAIPFCVVDVVFKTEWGLHPAFAAITSLLPCALTLAAAFRIGRPNLREVFAFRRVGAAVLGTVTVATASFTLLASELDNLVNLVLPMPKDLAHAFGQVFGAQHVLWGIVTLAVVAPLGEELLFRGLVLRGMLGRHSAPRAILAAAVLFGVVHANPWQAVSAVALGALLGWFYVRTRSLLPAILGHAVANAAAYSVAFLPFRIEGLNPVGVVTPGVFQPWWLDALGLGLSAAGLWAFARATRPRPSTTAPSATVVAASAEPVAAL